MTNTYKVTIKDSLFEHELTGTFEASTEAHAIEQAKDFYADSCDTNPDQIEIIKIIKQ